MEGEGRETAFDQGDLTALIPSVLALFQRIFSGATGASRMPATSTSDHECKSRSEGRVVFYCTTHRRPATWRFPIYRALCT